MNLSRLIKHEWLQIIILVAPFVIIPFIWDQLPDNVPTHWGWHGKANGWMPRGIGTFLIPVLNIAIALLLGLISKVDPKVAKANVSATAIYKLRLIITSFLLLFFFINMKIALGMETPSGTPLDTEHIPIYAIAVFLLLVGHNLPGIQPNYFIGVRTPWTLEDPENWRLTHKMTGHLWVIASIAFLPIYLVLPPDEAHDAFIIYLVTVIVPPIAYSFWLFQRTKKAMSQS